MAEEQLDWYAILGVERTATAKEITKAYRVKALKVHPDKNPDPNAAKVFHELSQAYDLLLDPAARAAFDNLLNVKVQAKARSDKYDSTRKKFMDDLKSREDAFKKQQQDEKAAAIRMKYEMERIKQEGIKKREAKEAELRRQAEEVEGAASAARQAARDEEATSLDATLRIKWKKKKHTFEPQELEAVFEKFGPIDSCLSMKPGSAVVSFKALTGAFAAMKAHEREVSELEPFTVSWAAGVEPVLVANLRSKEKSQPATTPTTSTPPSSVSTPKPAFNVASVGAPAFSAPAFGSGTSFAGFPPSIPGFRPPPTFNVAQDAPFVDDYEAATLARMKNKDNERKRLAEEILRMDQEEEERLSSKTDDNKKQRV
ncbi:DnaJ (Hsp40), sub C, member 17 [Podila verticillata]|nr:DnaJ (Hsp40), sub C, member 17 [Podila verticillata]